MEELWEQHNHVPRFGVGESFVPNRMLQLFYPVPGEGELVEAWYGDVYAEDFEGSRRKAGSGPEPLTPVMREQLAWSAAGGFWYPAGGSAYNTITRVALVKGRWRVTTWRNDRYEEMDAYSLNVRPDFWRVVTPDAIARMQQRLCCAATTHAHCVGVVSN